MLRAYVDEGQIGAYFLNTESHCRSMAKSYPNLEFTFTPVSIEGRILSMLPPQVAVFDLDPSCTRNQITIADQQDLIAVIRRRMTIHPRSTVIFVRN